MVRYVKFCNSIAWQGWVLVDRCGPKCSLSVLMLHFVPKC